MRMNRGFYTIMAAQFFSSLADSALLIAAIAVLKLTDAPGWMTPLLKLFFVVSYVVLAAFVGAFADSMPKGRVMLVTNFIKIVGCAMMIFQVHPLLSYAVVGFGAAAYSPAKYGILTELLPAEKLVAANGWVEGLTMISIILGTVAGGALVNPEIGAMLLRFDFPFIETGVDTPIEAALAVIMGGYVLAMLFNMRIPDTGARYPHQEHSPVRLLADFAECCRILWTDKLGQITLAITTLLWGAGAALQFIVFKWAEKSLHMPLDKASVLVGVTAIGMAVGATGAARYVPLKKSLSVMPLGIAMGVTTMTMIMVNSVWLAYPLLLIVGALAGFYVVPMNALLQHRGHVLMSAGHSIAVQNFNENISILIMLALYALMIRLDFDINVVIVLFGLFLSSTVVFVMRRHAANQKEFDSTTLIGEAKH